jgi:hypothetical protein
MRRALLALAASLLCSAGAAAQPSREDSLHLFLQTRFAGARAEYPETGYSSAFADLNGDGREEALVYMGSALFCGSTGCDLFVFTPAGESWREIGEISLGRPPVRRLNSRRRGWHDLTMLVTGDLVGPHEERVSFDGQAYRYNPFVRPARDRRPPAPGEVVMTGEGEGRRLFDQGVNP